MQTFSVRQTTLVVALVVCACGGGPATDDGGAGGSAAGGTAGGNSSAGGSAADAGTPGVPGSACTTASACASGQCVDGVCCDTACEGACVACVRAKTGSADGTCAPVTAGTDPDDECTPLAGSCQTGVCNGARACGRVADGEVCRPASGPCDAEERCSIDVCPMDSLAPATTVCRASAGACDLEERCTGASNQCPSNVVSAAGVVCRATAGTCDVSEVCDGTSPACPTDVVSGSGTVCRASRGTCDVEETCSGTSAACPVDERAPTTLVCRPAAGPCDVEERCTGSTDACPADTLANNTIVCRAAAGDCDAPERCDGSNAACPQDAKLTSVCRAAAGTCDVPDSCDGFSDVCPADAREPAVSEVCTPYRCTGTSAVCTSGACANDNACARGAFCRGGVCVRGKRVFVTSVGINGNMGGLAGADALCAARATAANIPGTFKAWLSTSTVSAASRLTQATVPYYRRTATTVTVLAQNFTNLTSGLTGVPGNISVDENGATVNANVWTGTGVNGLSAPPTCAEWTSTTATTGGRQGATISTDIGWWSSQGTASCLGNNRLYCFEQ